MLFVCWFGVSLCWITYVMIALQFLRHCGRPLPGARPSLRYDVLENFQYLIDFCEFLSHFLNVVAIRNFFLNFFYMRWIRWSFLFFDSFSFHFVFSFVFSEYTFWWIYYIKVFIFGNVSFDIQVGNSFCFNNCVTVLILAARVVETYHPWKCVFRNWSW